MTSNSNKLRVNQISKMHDRIIYAYKSRQRFYLPPQAPFCGVLADSHASFIYGNTLEYMTDALESTPAGVYGGGCSLDDCLRTEYANREPFPLTEILGSLYY